jgi:hypothetical protein
MEHTLIFVEAIHRAVDMELTIISVGKRMAEQPKDLEIEDMWEDNGVEGIAYLISWSTPSPEDFPSQIADAVKDHTLSVEDVVRICRTAERLASDPAEASRWPFKILFDHDAEPRPWLLIGESRIN